MKYDKDAKVYKARAKEIFQRPALSSEHFLNILFNNKENTSNINEELVFRTEKEDIPSLWFGEFLMNKIEQKNLTLKELSVKTSIDLTVLHRLLEDEIFPWENNKEDIIKLCMVLQISLQELKKQIDIVPIERHKLVKRIKQENIHIAARSDKNLSSCERQKKLLDSLVRIELEKQKEYKKDFMKYLEESFNI